MFMTTLKAIHQLAFLGLHLEGKYVVLLLDDCCVRSAQKTRKVRRLSLTQWYVIGTSALKACTLLCVAATQRQVLIIYEKLCKTLVISSNTAAPNAPVDDAILA